MGVNQGLPAYNMKPPLWWALSCPVTCYVPKHPSNDAILLPVGDPYQVQACA